MSDATEGVVAAIAATGGNDKVVFAAWDWIAKDDFGSDYVAFKDFRMLNDLCLVETATIEQGFKENEARRKEARRDVSLTQQNETKNATRSRHDRGLRFLCSVVK